MSTYCLSKEKRSIALIGSQAFSLLNFRGDLISEFVNSGIRVYALAPDFTEDTREIAIGLGALPIDYSLSRSGINPIKDFLAFICMIKVLHGLNVDISFGFSIKPVIYGTLASWLAGIPTRIAMIEGLGFVFTDYGCRTSLRKFFLRKMVLILYRLSLSKAHKVFFLNNDDIKEFLDGHIVSKYKIQYLNGIGVNLCEWSSNSVVISPITFLLAARLLREKGIFEYIDAARNIKAKHPTARFIVLGGVDLNPGSLRRDELMRWVHEGVIEWPGHVKVKPWLEQTSVFVLPSFYREGVPRSIQEAMAMSKPIITTNSPGCRDTVIDGENGYLVDVRNSKDLEVAMLRYIANPSLIASMGRISRQMAEEKFDVIKINKKIINIMGLR